MASTLDSLTDITRAKVAYADQEFDRAKEILEDILRARPHRIDAKLLLGQVHKELGKLAEARDLFQEALKTDSKNVRAAKGLAATYEELGQEDLAVAYWQRASSLDRDDASIWRKLGLAQYKTGNTTGAMTALSQSLALDNNQADLAGLVGDLAAGRATRTPAVPGMPAGMGQRGQGLGSPNYGLPSWANSYPGMHSRNVITPSGIVPR